MDTIHGEISVHEKQLFWVEQAGSRGNPCEYEGRHSYWDDGTLDCVDNTEGVAMEGKEKTHGREKGTEEDGVAVRDKKRVSEQESVEDFVTQDHTPECTTLTRRPCKPWTSWRRNMRSSRRL